MNPMGLMQNLLGNRDEESTTLTKSAISNNINININITLTDDPNAAATLQNLNRDTANANQKVTKHDLSKIEEQKELAQVIGDISANTVKMYTYTEQQKVEKARLEQGKIKAELEQAGKSAEEIAEDTRYQAATEALDTAQNEYDKAYGTGSTFHRVTTAVTAAVQAAATGDNHQAVVNLASPYLNQKIKDLTGDDELANAIGHAVLGALEAKVTGKDVLAGAAAGAGGEVAANFFIEHYYGKKPSELSEEEKQTAVLVGQLIGGLSAGVVGDSSVEAASGIDIARRAVENNALLLKDIYAYQRDLKRAIENGESTESIHEAYKALSEKQREALLADCEIDCRIPVINELGSAINRADEISGGVEGVLNDWLGKLSAEEQTRFYLVSEEENQKTIAALKAKQSGFEDAVDLALASASMLSKENNLEHGIHNKHSSVGLPKMIKGVDSMSKEGQTKSAPSNFSDQQKLAEHFDKHAKEFGSLYSSPSEYLSGARSVVQNGYKVSYDYKGEKRQGYVLYMGNTRKGESKFAFVGTNNKGQITTYHVESGKDFWKMINNDKNLKVINPIK